MDIKVTYDKQADAAYIYLTQVPPGAAVRQVDAIAGTVVLDFDAGDRLIGLEVLSASKVLPPDVCALAQQLT